MQRSGVKVEAEDEHVRLLKDNGLRSVRNRQCVLVASLGVRAAEEEGGSRSYLEQEESGWSCGRGFSVLPNRGGGWGRLLLVLRRDLRVRERDRALGSLDLVINIPMERAMLA